MDKTLSGIKAIFFDTSDTLYTNKGLEDAYPNRLVEMVAAEKALSFGEAKRLLDETAEKLSATEKHVTKIRTAAELGFTADEVYAKAFDKVVPADYLTKDVQLNDFILKLAQGYKLGIISNLKKSHVTKVVDALGLNHDQFTYYVTLDVVTKIKPDAEPFLKAIELAGCAANECLYIGDSLTKDIRPAKEVGMKTILVAQNPTDDDRQYADGVVSDVKAVADLLS